MIYFDKYIAHLTMGNATIHVQSFSSTEGKNNKNWTSKQNGSPRQKKKHGEGGGGASPGLTDTLSKEQFKYDMEKLNFKKYYKAFRIR